MIIWWRTLQWLSASQAVQVVSNFVCSQLRPTLPPAHPELTFCWAFGPAQQACSPTQNTRGTKTSGLPDSQAKYAERPHTAGDTLENELMSKFWPLSYKLKRIEIICTGICCFASKIVISLILDLCKEITASEYDIKYRIWNWINWCEIDLNCSSQASAVGFQ